MRSHRLGGGLPNCLPVPRQALLVVLVQVGCRRDVYRNLLAFPPAAQASPPLPPAEAAAAPTSRGWLALKMGRPLCHEPAGSPVIAWRLLSDSAARSSDRDSLLCRAMQSPHPPQTDTENTEETPDGSCPTRPQDDAGPRPGPGGRPARPARSVADSRSSLWRAGWSRTQGNSGSAWVERRSASPAGSPPGSGLLFSRNSCRPARR